MRENVDDGRVKTAREEAADVGKEREQLKNPNDIRSAYPGLSSVR